MAAVADVRPGLTRRRRERRRRQLRRIGIGALVLALVVGLVWLVFVSPVLAAKEVRVTGTSLLSTEQVASAAKVPLGTPLASFRAQPVADRVAELPEVGSVKVRARWPNTVVLEVTERTPAVQRVVNGQYTLIDAKGIVFHTQPEPGKDLVLVETPLPDQRLLGDLATVAQSLSPALRSRVVKITAKSPDTITLHLTKGQQVVWGSVAESETKSQVATALLRVKATVYDVSSPANPTSR